MWDSWQNCWENREFGPAWGVEEQLLIPSSCLSRRPVKKLQKFINFCLKVGYSANLKYSKSTWTTYHPVKGTKSWHQKLWAQCTLSTSWSRNGNNRSTTDVVLILDAFVRSGLMTNSVYTWVTHLHIAVPTMTRSLHYMNPRFKKWYSCHRQACHWCSYHILVSPVIHYLTVTVIPQHDICYREMFFNTNSFWQVMKSFQNPFRSCCQWHLLLFTALFWWGYKIVP